jgi:hypothetical protein
MSQAESEQFEADGWRHGVNFITAAQARHRGRFSPLPHFSRRGVCRDEITHIGVEEFSNIID